MTGGVDDILNDLIARVNRVRRWLLALSALRIAALGLACVSLYIGVYAWLDHHVHFSTLGRATALTLFLAMIAAGLYVIIRVLRRDMTYAHAANYIEGKRSFDQQLVAAVEYYEGRSDYPYSQVLAAQLVRQVDGATRGYRFDSTIAKWQGYLLSGFVLLCLCVVGFFVRQNVLYLSSYLARLLRPFSTIVPVPATALESATEDIVAGVDDPVAFDVAVEGRVPESATLVLTQCDPNDVNEPARGESERIELSRHTDADGRTRFSATKSFDAAGEFEYRFETSDARSDSHAIRVCEQPAIQKLTAKVFPPNVPQRAGPQDANSTPATRGVPAGEGENPGSQDSGKMSSTRDAPARNGAPGPKDTGGTPAMQGQPYDVELANQPLAVLPGSRVELTAQASTPLREAVVIGPDGQSTSQSLNGSDRFGFEFTADKSSSIQLSGVSTDGLASSQARKLDVVLKSDELPQFKLISPEGDSLATDVASVPIAVEVTDDVGLSSAELVCELPGRDPVVLESASPAGIRQISLTHVLEIEQHDLHVGDTILFYARAEDVHTGLRPAEANACSEVSFIEIRPYRQYWHPLPGGSQPSTQPGAIPEDLITVLEYTRAVVKKAWTLARSPGEAAADRPKLEALSADVQYCAAQLARIRDDPEAGFGAGDKAVINRVLESYGRTKQQLDNRDARAALPPAQDAYRILRMFIDELHLNWTPPQTGPSAPQETPERVKLQEQPQEPEMDAERIENRLQEMQQKIDSLSKQQQSLKADLAKAMQRERDAKAKPQAGADSGDPQHSGRKSQGGEKQTASQQSQSGMQADEGEGQAGQQTSSAESGSSKSGDSGQAQAQQPAGEQAGSGQGGRDGRSEQQGQSVKGRDGRSGDRQGDAQSMGSRSADGMPSNESGDGAQGDETRQTAGGPGQSSAQADARMRMLEARQKAVREQAAQMSEDLAGLPVPEDSSQGRASRQAKEHLDRAVEAMQQSEERLADARYESGDPSQAQGMTEPAESAARRLAEAGQAIRRGLKGEGDGSSDKAREMAEQLTKDAQAYDETLGDAEKQKMLDRLKAAQQLLESMAGAQWTTISSGGGPGASHVYTNDPHASPGEMARLLARQFWSVALKGDERGSRPVEQEPSDVEFFEAENEFFENAAKFGSRGAEK